MMIASRSLKLRDGANEKNVDVHVFAPERHEDGAWSCRYEIGWPEGKKTKCGWGVDSVQAIYLALQLIGTDIYMSSHHESGDLRFAEPGKGYGFPVPVTMRDLLVGDDAKFF
jgi:hypothetical protein